MQSTNSPDRIATEILNLGSRLVAIDGAHGSGKSTLARALANRLTAKLVEVDKFLVPNQGHYILSLDLKEITASIDSENICILEGICMQKVVELTGLTPDFNVYVKRMAKWGWADEDDLVFDVPIENHLQRLKQQAAPFFEHSQYPQLGLWEEIIRYHAEFRPQDICNITFQRSDA